MQKLQLFKISKINSILWFLIFTAIVSQSVQAQAPTPCPCDNCTYLQGNGYDYYDQFGASGCVNTNTSATYGSSFDAASSACIDDHIECNFIPVNDYSALLALLGVGLILLTKMGSKPLLIFLKSRFVKVKSLLW